MDENRRKTLRALIDLAGESSPSACWDDSRAIALLRSQATAEELRELGADDVRPFFECGVIRKFLHDTNGTNLTEFTGPSQTLIAATNAFSSSSALPSSRANHSAMFSALGLISVNGATSLMHP